MAAKIFPKLLNFEQKQCPLNIVRKMLTTFNDDPDVHWTWPSLTFFLFSKLNTIKGKRFLRLKNKNQNNSCWQYQKARFRRVSGIGKNGGISVLYLMGVEGDKIVMDK